MKQTNCFTINYLNVAKCAKPYHGRDGEISLVHFLGQPVDLPSGVAKDYRLGNRQRLVEIAQGVELPFLTLNSDIKLPDTFNRTTFQVSSSDY